MDFQGILRRQVKEVKERIQSLTGEVVSTTTLLLFFLLMPQLVPKLMAATKEEIKIRLDAKDNMQPGQKDSILYT